MERGDTVKWTMFDGNTMTGEILEPVADLFTDKFAKVRRVDGTVVNVYRSKLSPATYEDVQSAINFYANIGS